MNLLDVLQGMVQALLEQPRLLVLMALLVTAAVIDWRTLRIPNSLTVGGAVLGLMFSTSVADAPPSGLGFAMGGLALGLVLTLPLYLLGVMGAGDVKLMAMVGSFLGVPHTLHAVLVVFVTGGAMALGVVLLRRAWAPLLRNLLSLLRTLRHAPVHMVRVGGLAERPSLGKLPYGVSICLGTLLYLLGRPMVQV